MWCVLCQCFHEAVSTSSALASQHNTDQTVLRKYSWHTNEFIRLCEGNLVHGTFHFSFTSVLPSCCLPQPCQRWEETQREAPVSSPSPFWETLTSPAPHRDAAMARCGAPPARATMTTANGVSVLTKVWILFVGFFSCCRSGEWIFPQKTD